MSFLNENDIDFIAKIENQNRFVKQTSVILEYSQTIQMMLISNAKKKFR